MSFYTRIAFVVIIITSYSLSYIFSKREGAKALEKLLILFFGSLLSLSLLVPEKMVLSVAKILGLNDYTNSILFIFIVLSISVNFILTRKIIQLDKRIKLLTQNIALKEFNIKD